MSVTSYLLGAVIGGVVAWFFGYGAGNRAGYTLALRLLMQGLRVYRDMEVLEEDRVVWTKFLVAFAALVGSLEGRGKP